MFLATPHRGSDGASTLNLGMRISFAHADRQYTKDLERNSPALQSINDKFRHKADELELYSFYETFKTFIGYGNSMIVNRDSATLGYKNEQQFPIQSDHSNITKFDGQTDSNYRTIRNVLLSIVETHQRSNVSSPSRII